MTGTQPQIQPPSTGTPETRVLKETGFLNQARQDAGAAGWGAEGFLDRRQFTDAHPVRGRENFGMGSLQEGDSSLYF
ncbi:MAG: hypothetical protein KME26_15485 [Oscillatoria princeps RMCB-10]|nr:hypothetical protein [Oscillatoria princeps RMCB-10]